MSSYQTSHQVFNTIDTMLHILEDRIPKTYLLFPCADNNDRITRQALETVIEQFNFLYDDFLKTFGGSRE